jgi:Lamin Tail Domain/Staphylococcal nuclease homologue
MTTDVSNRDRYDRLLRYLWLDDGTFVNEVMVADGFALARDYPPDSRYAAQLAGAQDRAEVAGLGLWAPDACGPASAGDLQITFIEYDAPGNDHENLNGEWVEITNTGTSTEAMSSWVLKDESASHRYTFSTDFTLSPGSNVKVYTGCGTDTTAALYWCSSNGAVWNNDGDTAFLLDTSGNLVDKRSY